MSNARSSGAELLIAFLSGAAIGAAVALLTARRPGSETRAVLRDWAEGAERKVARVPHALKKASGRAAAAVKEALAESLKPEESKTEEG